MYENIRDIKIDKARLDALSSMLAHGDISAVAKQLKMSHTAVKQTLKGEQFNRAVIEAVIKRIEDRNAFKIQLESNIDRVIKS